MKVTAEQIKKWNAACSNGWAFDTQNFNNEKRLVAYINLDDKCRLCAILYYKERKRGECIPCLHLSKWTLEGSCWHSRGTGTSIYVGEPQSKKMFSVLQKLTANYPENVLLDLANEHTVELNNPYILGK